MSEEIEKFIKRNYDNIRRAYEFDNIARKKVVEAFQHEFAELTSNETDWAFVGAHIRMEWESLKELLDPLNATREALMPVVEARGEMLAKPDGASWLVDVMEAQEALDKTRLDDNGANIGWLVIAGAHIVAAIEKLQKEAKG